MIVLVFLPFKAALDEIPDRFIVDLLLQRVWLVDKVVGEGLVGTQPHLRIVRGLGDADLKTFRKIGLTLDF